MNSPVASVGPHIAAWPACLGIELADGTQPQKHNLVQFTAVILTLLFPLKEKKRSSCFSPLTA